MGDLFGASRDLAYRRRLSLLKESGVALWDVVFQCERNGSLDAAIDMNTVQPNDFQTLFAECPSIRSIFFNGHKAEELFKRLVVRHLGDAAERFRFMRLPSTSPAHASCSRAQKISMWKKSIRPQQVLG